MRPDRPRLAEARAVVIGLTDVRAAWEALIARSLVPAPSSPYDPGAYRGHGSLGHGTEWQPLTHTSESRPTPPTIDDAVALASDPEGISRASRLAAEFLARVRPWRREERPEDAPQRVWRVLKLPASEGLAADDALAGLYDEMLARIPSGTWSRSVAQAAQRACGHVTGAVAQRFSVDVVWAMRWQMLVARDLRQAVTGLPYAEMPDPTGPRMAVWGLGYAIGNISSGGLTMIAPAV